MFKSDYVQALNDYKKVRRSEAVNAVLARITGGRESADLLSYEEVRDKLQAIEKSAQHLREIPLDSIVGSVGRYHDFSRQFLPKSSIDEKRWARVKASTLGLTGLPPIEVYQIGDAYFVKDGNHRVSVARQMGNPFIQAYVTEVQTKVPLPANATPDDLIIKSEQVKFLEITRLDQSRPDSDLTATTAGAYPTLLEHIAVHRYFMGLEQQREIPFQESAADWYDAVFLPVVSIIRQRGLLRDFPERTAADLYLWSADHRARLTENLGWDIGSEAAIGDLSEISRKGKARLKNLLALAMRRILPDYLEGGPPPGTWRERLSRMTVLKHLFNDIIIALDESSNMWRALELGLIISRMENSRIHGIHIHPADEDPSAEEHRHLENTFNSRCQNAGCQDFDFRVADGEISKVLSEQARYADLILLPLNHPPGDKPILRLGSGLIGIIRTSPVPVLTVPTSPTEINTILVAYDDSGKAREALYIAAYLGSQHSAEIIVLTSTQGISDPKAVQDQARKYLTQFPIKTQYVLSELPVSGAISRFQAEARVDLVAIGGYGGSTILDVMLGSAVDQVLREIRLPVLICR